MVTIVHHEPSQSHFFSSPSPSSSYIVRMGDEAHNLPPGFRFFPTDEELVVHFLGRKVALLPCHPDVIPSLDLHLHDPWELSDKALAGGNGWYCFSKGQNSNRVSANGCWKTVGVDENVTSRNKTVGIKKTLAFYIGEASEGIKTNWMMHEYHLLEHSNTNTSNNSTSTTRRSSKKRGHPSPESNVWVLCRVFETSCYNDGTTELSCLDEVFLSLDDLDEISLPN